MITTPGLEHSRESAGGGLAAAGAGDRPSTHSTSRHAGELAVGLPLPIRFAALSPPPDISKSSRTQPLRVPGKKRRKASAPPPSTSSDDEASVLHSDSTHVRTVASRFAEVIQADLRRQGLDLTAPRRERPPPRDRSLPGLQASGTNHNAEVSTH